MSTKCKFTITMIISLMALIFVILVGNVTATETKSEQSLNMTDNIDEVNRNLAGATETIEENILTAGIDTEIKMAKMARNIDRYIQEELIAHAQPQEDSRHTLILSAIENDRIMFVGNSLVEGLRLNNNSSNQFYCKVGVSLNGLQSKIYSQIDNADFDIAVIEMGTNELGGWSEDNFKAGYFDLIDHILSNNPSAQVICLSIPPVSKNKDNSGERFNNNNVVKYNHWIEDLSNTLEQVVYVDCSGYFGDVLDSSWTGDGIHLSGNIYLEWYNYIIDEMNKLYT